LLAMMLGAAPDADVATMEAAGFSNDDWNRVLSRYVDEQGRVDYDGLARNDEALESYVEMLSKISPASHPDLFPTPQHELAYYINAYNALAMYNVLVSGKLPDDQIGFFVFQQFNVGGTYRSLYNFENNVIRRVGEPRVHFALNCVTRSCPRLPREPFEAARLEDQLDAAAREFLNDDDNVAVNVEEGRLYLSWIMSYYKKDFLKSARTLGAYVNLFRDEPVPEDDRVWWLEYDWTLNSQDPRPFNPAPRPVEEGVEP